MAEEQCRAVVPALLAVGPGHRAACPGDQVHDLVTPRLAGERPLNSLHLASNAAHARQQFLLIANSMAHGAL